MREYIITTHDEPDVDGSYRLTKPAEEIVRCRDCKHLNIVGKCPCGFWALENLNGFCAWGERRERESVEVWNQWSVDDVTCSEES